MEGGITEKKGQTVLSISERMLNTANTTVTRPGAWHPDLTPPWRKWAGAFSLSQQLPLAALNPADAMGLRSTQEALGGGGSALLL